MPKADSKKPYVSNYPPLSQWLEAIEARCLWQEMKTLRSVECYQAPSTGQVFIVVVHANSNGWEIYTACNTNKIDETLHDAEVRLGLRNDDA